MLKVNKKDIRATPLAGESTQKHAQSNIDTLEIRTASLTPFGVYLCYCLNKSNPFKHK